MMSRESFLLFYRKLNTSIKNIERWIKQLRNEEKMEFRDSPKTGGYYAKK